MPQLQLTLALGTVIHRNEPLLVTLKSHPGIGQPRKELANAAAPNFKTRG
jgi:hypothetical protein